MKIIESNLEKRVQFWSLLGPFFILLIFFVTLVKVSHSNIPLALVSMMAIPVCWRWKVYGLACVIGTLIALIAFHFSELSLIDRFWEVGMGIAISIACTVTTLSFEEVENLVQSLQVQSDSRLTNIWHLDEKLKKLQETYQAENKTLADQIEQYHVKIHQYQTDLTSYEKLSQAAQEELLVYQNKNNELMKELLDTRNKVSLLERTQQELLNRSTTWEDDVNQIQQVKIQNEALQEELEELRINHNHSVIDLDSKLRQSEGKYRQLARQFKEKSDILDDTRRELFMSQESLTALTREIEEQKSYGNDPIHEGFVNLLIRTKEEHELQCQEYLEEINQLHEIVTHLVESQKNSQPNNAPAPLRRIIMKK